METNKKMSEEAKSLPDFFCQTSPELIIYFLSELKQKYGSVRGYLEAQGADQSLFASLEKALLV